MIGTIRINTGMAGLFINPKLLGLALMGLPSDSEILSFKIENQMLYIEVTSQFFNKNGEIGLNFKRDVSIGSTNEDGFLTHDSFNGFDFSEVVV